MQPFVMRHFLGTSLASLCALVMLCAWPEAIWARAPDAFSPAQAANHLFSRAALALASRADAPANQRIAVIYPRLGEPYRSVFRQIVGGIEEAASDAVVSIELDQDDSVEALSRELAERRVGVVIALGRHGLQVAAQLPDALPVVGGAVLASPDDRPPTGTLVSLAPDPRQMIDQLKRLAPSVQRVFVVYSPKENHWLVELAAPAASARGLELVPIATEDLRSALKEFHGIMDAAEVGRDAIWLPQDSRVLDDQVILPFVLQKAWDRSIVVFSSTLGHVRRGALFALYPDNEEMGHQLATSAKSILGQQRRPLIEPVNHLRLALNTRTAGHLGLNLEAIEDEIALRFPAR